MVEVEIENIIEHNIEVSISRLTVLSFKNILFFMGSNLLVAIHFSNNQGKKSK